MSMNNEKSASESILQTAGQAMGRTEKNGITSSSNECADSGHHTTVLILIAEVCSNDAENEGAGVRRHLVTICEINAAPGG